MTYFVCPRCQLSIHTDPYVRTPATDCCPRCLGREDVRVAMFSSPLTYRELTQGRVFAEEPR
jgi:Zn-finger nucleic acid-binding protein